MPAHRSDSRGLLARLPTRVRVGLAALFFVVIALIPTFISQQYYLDVLIKVGLWAMLACGLNIVVAQAGLLDLGYIAFWGVGAYTTALFSSTAHDLHLPTWVCLPASAAAAAVFAIIIGFPTLRLRGDYLAIVTLGFGEIVRLLADNLKQITGGGQGLSRVAFPRLGEDSANPLGVFSAGNNASRVNSGVWWFWVGIVLIVLVLVIVGNLERSRVGRAWVAIREDEDAAEIMGVPTFKFKLWAFVIGASVGGLSGALFAGQVQFVVPTGFNVINSVLFLCAVVLGGQGNKLGVIVGAFIVVYLPNRVMSIQVGAQSLGDYKYLFFGLALIVLMIFRPQGLLPVRQKLLTYGRQVFLAVHKVRSGKPAESTP